MRSAIAVLISALTFLTACVSVPTITEWSPETVATKCRVLRDDFRKSTSITSPAIYFGRCELPFFQKYRLHATLDDGAAEPTYAIGIETVRSGQSSWAFWFEAFDRSGKKFALDKISSEVGPGVSVEELVSARLSAAEIEGMRQSGAEWKIYGRRATDSLEVTPNLVDGFLRRCAEIKAARAQ